MKFRSKITGEEITIQEPAATIIKQQNLEIIDLKAENQRLRNEIYIYKQAEKERRFDIPDFLKGFGKK